MTLGGIYHYPALGFLRAKWLKSEEVGMIGDCTLLLVRTKDLGGREKVRLHGASKLGPG